MSQKPSDNVGVKTFRRSVSLAKTSKMDVLSVCEIMCGMATRVKGIIDPLKNELHDLRATSDQISGLLTSLADKVATVEAILTHVYDYVNTDIPPMYMALNPSMPGTSKETVTIKKTALKVSQVPIIKGLGTETTTSDTVDGHDESWSSSNYRVKWEDVPGLEDAKKAIAEAAILALKLPKVFTKRKGCKSILLFGPPGTGKSYLATAQTSALQGYSFVSMSCLHLASQSAEESCRCIANLFEKARARSPCIIFIDEVSFVVATEFRAQMDNAHKNNDGLLVLGATNTPWAVDSLILSRFEKMVYVPLPKVTARSEIFKQHMAETKNSLDEADYEELGKVSDGFSSYDILAVVDSALMRPIRKIMDATHFKKMTGPLRSTPNVIVDDLMTPCDPEDEGAVKMTYNDVQDRDEKLREPEITMEDMMECLEGKTHVRATNYEAASKFEPFMEKYGLK